MNTNGNSRSIWVLRLAILAVSVLAIVAVVRFVGHLGDVPRSQQEVEAHLDRSILTYVVWDGTPYVVFEFGGMVHFDTLILDWISIEWPPTPRWQWSGYWSSIESTTDPASVRVTDIPSERAIYGQVNSGEIAWLEIERDGEWYRFAVSAPAFAVRLPEDLQSPDTYRWLDADGRVVWTVER